MPVENAIHHDARYPRTSYLMIPDAPINQEGRNFLPQRWNGFAGQLDGLQPGEGFMRNPDVHPISEGSY
jgi:hypothetical protein